MEIDENYDSISQEIWKSFVHITREDLAKSEKLEDTVGKIHRIVKVQFEDKPGLFPDQLIDEFNDLCNVSCNYYEKEPSGLKRINIMIKETGFTVKVCKIYIEFVQEHIKELEALQCSADILLGRCIEYTQKSAAA
jgi:hypothetical protein